MYDTKQCTMQQVGKPVTGIDFIGREKELALLLQYMKMGQSVVLIAPRRFGKTSLVREALSILKKQGFYTASVDVFANPGLEMLSTSITEEVLKNNKLDKQFIKAKNSASALINNIKLKALLDDFQFIIGFAESNKNEQELLSGSIDFVDSFSKKHHKKIICAYDEFGDIRKFDPKGEIVKLFRAKMQLHSNSTYLFSGSYESVMDHMFINRKSPFYRLVRIIRLEYIEPSTFINYFEARFKELNLTLPPSYLKTIIGFTRGHPYYSQLAFQQIVLFKALYNYIPEPEILLDEMLNIESDYIEKVWEDITNNRELVYVLKAIAYDGKNIYKRLKTKNINVARATKQLEGMGLLFKDEIIGYYISDPLLVEWIKKNSK